MPRHQVVEPVAGVNGPTLLAFDTSGPHCAAALLSGGRVVADAHENMMKGQVERLMPMLQQIMDQHGVGWDALDAIAVGTGPGNFTGIRIAVSAARGLALGSGVRAIGATGFEALRGPDGLTDGAPMLVSLPSSRRGYDVVLQYFKGCRAIGSPVELSLQDCADAGEAGKLALPRLHPGVRILGYAAATVSAALGDISGEFDRSDLILDLPAIAIARVAAARLRLSGAIPRPVPLYIRPPDAAPARAVPPVV